MLRLSISKSVSTIDHARMCIEQKPMMLCWDISCLYLHGVLNCHEISISTYSFYVYFINRLPSIAANILIITLFLIKTAGICLN